MSSSDLIAKAVGRIPPQLRREEFRFVPIIRGDKRPFEGNWNKPGGNNYSFNNPKLAGFMLSGHNYGVCTGMGDLIIFDSDAELRLQELGVSEALPETFSVRTGGGGLHRYYLCKDTGEKIIMFDKELVGDEGKPLHLGEVQTLGFQCVCPGSVHPNGNLYRVEVDAPIAEVAWSTIYDILEERVDFGLASDFKKQEARVVRVKDPNYRDPFENVWVEDVMRPAGKVRERDGILTGSHPVHGSTGGQNFSVNTKKNTWYCFRCNSGGGPALAVAVKEGIISCAEAKKGVLRGELYLRVLEVAKEKGYIKPALRTVERIL